MSDSVTRWLQELGFGQYATAFAEEQIDDEVLLELTDADLKELSIPATGFQVTRGSIDY